MSSVLSTVITEERGLCYQQISVFYEIFPSHFRCLSELKFSSTRDNQADSENTNVGFVSWCTWLPTRKYAALLSSGKAIQITENFLFLLILVPFDICSNSPFACFLMLSCFSFFSLTPFQSDNTC